MNISLIASLDQHNLIGNQGTLPWHLPKDLAYFKETTTDHLLIMGRRTYESIPDRFRPLSRRYHIILSSSVSYLPKDLPPEQGIVVHNLTEAFSTAQQLISSSNAWKKETVFVIGGSSLYATAMPYATHLYLTHIEASISGDTFFPNYNPQAWKLIARSKLHQPDVKHAHSFYFATYSKVF